MVIDEDFDFLSSGSQYAAVNNGNGTLARSARIHASRQLRGPHLQHAAGTSDGRETRVSLLPLVPGYARQCRNVHELRPPGQSHPTSFTGPTRPHCPTVPTATDTDNSFSASSNGVAFAGGFGVAGSYKFLPNLVGHVSYDMLWVGDIARAPEQMELVRQFPRASATSSTPKARYSTTASVFGLELDW